MRETTATRSRPPPWRDVRVLRIVGQAVFVLVVVVVVRELFLNLRFGLREQGQDLSWEHLRQRAGFDIAEGLVPYSPNSSYWRAYQLAVTNTVKAALAGIVLSSVIGLFLGIARLSPNWLLRKIAQVWVETLRNTPLLVQVFFWYVGVVLTFPRLDEAISAFGVMFLSIRGSAVPWFDTREGAGLFWLAVLGALVAAWAVARWRQGVMDRTGEPSRKFVWGTGTFLLVAGIAYAVMAAPVTIDAPEIVGRRIVGGAILTPEYTALLLALVTYTSAFIAEIVRGSILAVSKGQKEAAEALGLTPGQQLRFVVLPQALRIAVPPINSQYLNLTKNTSLGALIAFPEVVQVGRTIINQAGRATQMLLLWMVTYLTLSLSISLVMNIVNRVVTRRGER